MACFHTLAPYSVVLRSPEGVRAIRVLDQLRPRAVRGGSDGWTVYALPEQWKRGVNENEWVEYVPPERGIPGNVCPCGWTAGPYFCAMCGAT